jgi:galactose mutarotase-like enzyme
MQIQLENDKLKVAVNTFGAEIASIYNKANACEYLWNADGAYWKRSAPVLFPFVGSLKNKEFLYDGKAYPMGQHGFARDMEFTVVSATDNEAWFQLSSNEETLAKYPFAFSLSIGYILSGSTLKVLWKVANQDNKEMYFSIGGHPAFMCPLNGQGQQTDYYISFDTDQNLTYSLLSANGLVEKEGLVLDTQGGMLPVDAHMFDRDALIIEGKQASKVSLCTPDKKPYLSVQFDAPLFGLWSPAGKNAPFICIEPWYGRCDKESFTGTLAEREYGNTLQPEGVFEVSYEIEVL